MTSITTQPNIYASSGRYGRDRFDHWFDPLEAEVRARSRRSLKGCFAPNSILRWHGRVTDEAGWPAMKKEAALQATATVAEQSLTGTFGPIEIAVPRARLTTPEGKTAEWKSQALRGHPWGSCRCSAGVQSRE